MCRKFGETSAEYQKRRYHEDPEFRRRHKESQNKWLEKNKEKQLKYRREWAKQNRDKYYAIQRKAELKKKYKKYGVTDEWFHQKLAEQNSLCAICSKPEVRIHNMSDRPVPLSIDHDHSNGQVRGLLCWTCNINLHRVEDSGWLENAIRYLKSFEEKT